MATVDQALALWRQLGSPGIGWIRVGFRPGILMARGRGDGARERAMADAFLTAVGALRTPYDVALVEDDLEVLTSSAGAMVSSSFGATMIADALREMADAGWDSSALMSALPDRYWRLPLVAPEMHRGRGLATRDAAMLRSALELAHRGADMPTAARLEVELGRLTDDPALVDQGRASLLAMGDFRQLERYGLA
jgi:hypothetical protein